MNSNLDKLEKLIVQKSKKNNNNPNCHDKKPNRETKAAMIEAENHENLESYESVDELFNSIHE